MRSAGIEHLSAAASLLLFGQAQQFGEYSRKVAAGGGVLTVDLQLFRNGSMNADQVALLREAWRGLKTTDDHAPSSARTERRTGTRGVGMVLVSVRDSLASGLHPSEDAAIITIGPNHPNHPFGSDHDYRE